MTKTHSTHSHAQKLKYSKLERPNQLKKRVGTDT
uniref:Uncharacterized protein n=1 Tax=Rhizophora mucronata TaxID=61149 RepID=A0A2P2PXV3_RHIMU